VEKTNSSKEGVSGRSFAGFILLGLGILFLLTNWGIIPSLHRTWPLILIIVGLAFLLGTGGKEKVSTPLDPNSDQTPSQPEEPTE